MEIRIGEPLLQRGYKNTFKLVLSHWQNGAENISRTILIDKSDIGRYMDFLNLLAWCNRYHPEREDLQRLLEAIEDKHNCQFSRYFPLDDTAPTQITTYPAIERLTFFDSTGIERNVEVIFDRIKIPKRQPFRK